MTLANLYEYLSDNQNLIVLSSDGSREELGRYDGRNSIEDTEQANGFTLNDCEVDYIEAENNTIVALVNNWF